MELDTLLASLLCANFHLFSIFKLHRFKRYNRAGLMAGRCNALLVVGFSYSKSRLLAQITQSQDRDSTVVGDATLRSRAAAKKFIYKLAASQSEIYSDEKFANQVSKEGSMLLLNADPVWGAVELVVYNNNRLEFDTDQCWMRTDVLKLLKRLTWWENFIHALGIQAHVWYNTDLKSEKLLNFLRNIADLGLKILVAEMDVMDKDLPTNIAIHDRAIAGLYALAGLYKDILSAIVEESTVIGVNTWDSDKHTWISAHAPEDKSTSMRLLSSDRNMHRQLAWNGIDHAFDKATKRRRSS